MDGCVLVWTHRQTDRQADSESCLSAEVSMDIIARIIGSQHMGTSDRHTDKQKNNIQTDTDRQPSFICWLKSVWTL